MYQVKLAGMSLEPAALVAELSRRAGRPGPDRDHRQAEELGRLLTYLDAAILHQSPRLFLDYVAWARGPQMADSLPDSDLRLALTVVAETLAATGQTEQGQLVAQALDAFEGLSPLSCSAIDETAPGGRLARDVLDDLLHCDVTAALGRVMAARERGDSVQHLYMRVFQPCLHEVGRLWQSGHLTVAQEHYVSAAIQTIMARLYPAIFQGARKDLHLMAACVSGELHEIGIRMVADIFEMEGWRTSYLGASTPVDSLVRMIADQRPDVVAVSATLSCHVPLAAALVYGLRTTLGIAAPSILVGGAPFLSDAELWRRIGADGTAPDALAAVALAEKLVAARP